MTWLLAAAALVLSVISVGGCGIPTRMEALPLEKSKAMFQTGPRI